MAREIRNSILIVEDDNVLLKTLSEQFEDEGFDVYQAANGAKGLALAKEHEPDVILLDILLPQMNGMDVLGKIRAHNSWGEEVPVIMLTNLNADDEIMVGVAKYEPSFYIVKENFELQDLVTKVNACLETEEVEQ